MAQLSPHFTEEEFHVQNAPDGVREMAAWGAVNILEPVRAMWGPVLITSGYRTPEENRATGGVDKSFHLYQGRQGAADFMVPGKHIETVFDWLRDSRLPFDKVILEYSAGAPQIIHVQWALYLDRARTAWVGETHGAGEYREVECA